MILGFAIANNGWAMYLVAVPGYLLFSPAMVIAAAWATISHGDLRKNTERPWMEPRWIRRYLDTLALVSMSVRTMTSAGTALPPDCCSRV